MDEFKFKLGEEVYTYDWPGETVLRCKVISRQKKKFNGTLKEEYKVELLEGEKEGRQILIFGDHLWKKEKGGKKR